VCQVLALIYFFTNHLFLVLQGGDKEAVNKEAKEAEIREKNLSRI